MPSGAGTIFGQGGQDRDRQNREIGNAKQRSTLEFESLFVPKTSVLQKKVFVGFWSIFLSQRRFTTQVSGGAKVAQRGPKYLQGGRLPPYFPRLCLFIKLKNSHVRLIKECNSMPSLVYEENPHHAVNIETAKKTFKYHITFRQGGCSNRQSAVIWREGVGQIVI